MFRLATTAVTPLARRTLSTTAGALTEYKFTKDHLYVAHTPGSTVAKVGLAPAGAIAHGPVAYVALPDPESQVEAGESVVSLECSLSANEKVASPVSGHVLAPNYSLFENPSLVNDDPLDAGHFVELRMTEPTQLDSLLDAAEYEAYLAQQS
ncbi:glycine cleavage system H protein [Thecamonas trahens ATCC 50062]|uniref:Glycine cleavage system H protein n=1 Tax=Thecamonas trahens ATCC 50062 TaxID=461836 RepID=A0A0L0D180_THETB|nr:glycine cleavage system H protein [Thecamonas trahens ATCC 50062]KNC45981.1 glycine cleavage system H protein [Thecamonas trahens ATCC 50062]|eukprot:XP_013762962.1 glycine cleavage system H protein [Thecamonas trahens ATCC 50062]